jgi:hypothetical protein
MKVLYTSPVFKNADGSGRQFMIPAKAVQTYAKRDAALLVMTQMGGIHAKLTPEFIAKRKVMMSAKRKIEREGWFCEMVTA